MNNIHEQESINGAAVKNEWLIIRVPRHSGPRATAFANNDEIFLDLVACYFSPNRYQALCRLHKFDFVLFLAVFAQLGTKGDPEVLY